MTVPTHVSHITSRYHERTSTKGALFDMFEQHKYSYHKASSQHASEYIKFAIPSLPLSTMKELVKNTVRYVSFDEPLLELVVQAVLLELFDADVPPATPARSAPASSAATTARRRCRRRCRLGDAPRAQKRA